MAKSRHRNQVVYELAQEWVRWLDTRRFFGPPSQKNILAKLQKDQSPSRGEPDAELLPEISAFNQAVSSLDVGDFVPFVVLYCGYRPAPIKVLAYELGIQAPAFYDRADKAAGHVQHLTVKLVEMNLAMRRELVGMV